MRTISVIYSHDIWQDEDVNIIVDGQCHHKRIEFEHNNDNEQIAVCQRCDAWKYTHNDLNPEMWYDEVILEECV